MEDIGGKWDKGMKTIYKHHEIHIEEGTCGESWCEQAHVWAVDGAARRGAAPPGGGEASQAGVARGSAADSGVVWD